MSDLGALYQTDYSAWAQRHAEILRAGRYAESDLEHLLEELSDMSRSERREPESRLMQRVVWVLTTAVTLNACDVCMTTQCRGRPFLPSQEVISGGHPGIQIPRIPRAVYYSTLAIFPPGHRHDNQRVILDGKN